jgi:hypothetical protein
MFEFGTCTRFGGGVGAWPVGGAMQMGGRVSHVTGIQNLEGMTGVNLG